MLGTVIAGAIVGSVVASLFGGDQARISWRVDVVTASIVLLAITFFIIKQKNLAQRSMLINFLPLATAAVALYVAPAIALVIPTFLSTLPPYTKYTPPPSSGNDGANENDYQNNPPQTPPKVTN